MSLTVLDLPAKQSVMKSSHYWTKPLPQFFSNTQRTCRLLAIIILTGIQGFRSRRTDSWGKCGWDRCRWRQIVGYKTRRGRIQKRIGWICCERALGSVSTFRLSSCSCPLAGSSQQFLKQRARKNASFNFFSQKLDICTVCQEVKPNLTLLPS